MNWFIHWPVRLVGWKIPTTKSDQQFPAVESSRWPYVENDHKQGEQNTKHRLYAPPCFTSQSHSKDDGQVYSRNDSNTKCWSATKKTRSLPFIFLQLWLVACWCIAVHGNTGFFWQVLQSLQADHGPHFVVIQPQSVTWCLVSRHQKHIFESTKS